MNIIVAFSSMSGNTEEIANRIIDGLKSFPFIIEKKEMDYLAAADLLKYDGILIGSYTYGDGDLPFESEGFFDELDDVDLTGKKAAVFGSGDSDYPNFCEAVNTFEDKLKECGAELVNQGLKIELAPDSLDDIDRCTSFAIEFANRLTLE